LLYGFGFVGFSPQVTYLFETSDANSYSNYSLASLSQIYQFGGLAIGNGHTCAYGVYTKTVRHGWNFDYFYTFYISTKITHDPPSNFNHIIVDGPTQNSSDFTVVFHQKIITFYYEVWSRMV